jgi:two-component system NarL family response regulator
MSQTLIPPIRILIAEDHPIMRDSIGAAATANGTAEVVASVANGRDAIFQFVHQRPDVSLIDLQMPVKDGLETITAIRAIQPDARIIVLTTFDGAARMAAARAAGAAAYLLKHVLGSELREVIRHVHRGGYMAPPPGDPVAADRLSRRELEVLRLVATGRPNRAIGDMLGISEPTVKSHMTTILEKLGAADRAHAVALGIRHGYLSA